MYVSRLEQVMSEYDDSEQWIRVTADNISTHAGKQCRARICHCNPYWAYGTVIGIKDRWVMVRDRQAQVHDWPIVEVKQ